MQDVSVPGAQVTSLTAPSDRNHPLNLHLCGQAFHDCMRARLLIHTIPSHPNCSPGPPACFQGLFPYCFQCKKMLTFLLKEKFYYYPRITYIFKWLKCENVHFSARPQTHGFNVFLMTSQSVNHYIPSAVANGGYFLLGRRSESKILNNFNLNLRTFSC